MHPLLSFLIVDGVHALCSTHLVGDLARATTATSPFFWDPMHTFGLAETVGVKEELPLLIVLPGLDGSGVTAWTQYPELARDYEILALTIPPEDRATYLSLCSLVAAAVEAGSLGGQREVYLLGESMGAGVALELGRRHCTGLKGLVLVSPATGWDQTWLGKLRTTLVELPDWALTLVVLLTSYQLLDLEQITTTVRRIATGEKSPLLASEERLAYAWKVVGELPVRLNSPAASIRHRISEWAEPTIAAGKRDALSDIRVPMLVVAGTRDLRVPAAAEGERIVREAPRACEAKLHLVKGAGHAGATDDRVDLRSLMEDFFSR